MSTHPLVTIGMAVYKPNMEWFIKQLQSIDNQDYESIELLIWNDSPKSFTCDEVVAKYVKNIPFRILDNGTNNGVTRAFENVTKNAEGKYIAYSDQDDIWMPNKISMMTTYMENHPDCVCCHSDVQLINETDTVVRQSLYPVSLSRLNEKDYQETTFLVDNWNIGCAMMMKTSAAKAAIPFPTMVYHDQWLEMYTLSLGDFSYIPDCLIQHRVHGTNNSQTLNGVHTKRDYYNVKLAREVNFFDFVTKKLSNNELYSKEGNWIAARKNYSEKFSIKNFAQMIRYISVRPTVTIFELLLPFIPDSVFAFIVKSIRKEVRTLGVR